jgi:hypothetical protein
MTHTGAESQFSRSHHLRLPTFSGDLTIPENSFVDPLFLQLVAIWNFAVGGDLANPQVPVLKDLEPTFLLNLVHTERRPADNRPSCHARSRATGRDLRCTGWLIVDEAVAFLEFGVQEFGELRYSSELRF